ncbi:hypothetical protein ASPWEDRAFT_174341 [Aspergillus wentii DTO 134E9]|uniref:Uncharacterized protein n=1 Tax=Aspergillus wentii DTO 134E9 TaxID=1073089 RepID=A0A1L9RDB3_ASPWE|nr:uncharacterized protein ASPWEDRAFT_174341 [Aspergillus wentii DTO 134E9]KAI9933184.1 hypothetical protein MW887_007655 [Aspergillus wentii]OJJ32911.1 hypothetical protein ASPWEDRAFT_174341 [Aspergillus wentii DTO 134E9]
MPGPNSFFPILPVQYFNLDKLFTPPQCLCKLWPPWLSPYQLIPMSPYLEIPGIDIDLAFLDRHDLEFSVRSAWLGILDNYYTRNHRYTHDVEARNKEGYSDILCKRVSYEGRNSEWFGAKDQLQNYFRAIYDRYNPTNPAGGGPIPRHIYGAIAIGRFVRFYWYNTRTRRLNMLEPRPETTRWHVIDESHYVHHVLDFIRNNH